MEIFNIDEVTLTSQLKTRTGKLTSQVKKLYIAELLPQVFTVAKLASELDKDLEFRL